MSGAMPSRRAIPWTTAAAAVVVAIPLFEPLVIVRAGYRGCCSILEQCSSSRCNLLGGRGLLGLLALL